MLPHSMRCMRAIAAAYSDTSCANAGIRLPPRNCSGHLGEPGAGAQSLPRGSEIHCIFTLAQPVDGSLPAGQGTQLVSLDQEETMPQIPSASTAQPERVAQSRQQARRLMELVRRYPPLSVRSF